MHEDDRTEFDDRIDAALRRYADAALFSEPRVALARVRMLADQEPQRRSPWRVWVWAAPGCAAVLIAAFALWMLLRVPQAAQIAWTPKAPGVASVVRHADLQQGSEKRNTGSSSSLRHKQQRQSFAQQDNSFARPGAERRLPKQEVFPTPEPLSLEEQRLLAFVTQAPPDVKKQVIEAQQHLGDPIQIAALKIRPLDEDEKQIDSTRKDLR
ncbi:MAG TPA: hypothetical protein VKT75_15130 [Acidobacteriaceae bacterium]|nr:hypothetical protein [Acidobacteriaceae bacterium]